MKQRKKVKTLLSIGLCLLVSTLPAEAGQDPSQRVDALFSEFTGSTPGVAVAVVRDGEAIFRSGYGMADLEHGVPVTPETVFDIASVSKQFTGMAIAMLVEEGRIDLDAQVRDYLPELPDFGYSLTVRHLVHHTSGIRDWPATLAASGWKLDDVISFDQILRMAWNQKELNFEPGPPYSYSNTGYNLLAEIVARVSGRQFRSWTGEHIFTPLGMGSTHFRDDHTEIVKNRANGYGFSGSSYTNIPNGLTALGSSSLFSSVDDLAKWIINFDSRELGGVAVHDRMRTRGRLSSGEEISYAYGIGHGTYRGLSTWSHSGSWAGFRTHLLHFPEQRFGVVILSNSGGYNPGRRAYTIADIYLEGKLSPEITTTERNEVAVEPAVLDEYAGTYRLDAGRYVVITRSRDALRVRATNEAEFPMTAVSETEFWVEAYNGAIRFERDGNGVVSNIEYRNITAPRVEPFDATGLDLNEFTGRFRSDELDTRYTLIARDGALVASHRRHGEILLTAVQKDEFTGNMWFFSPVTFVRDQNGSVTDMLIGRGRARNLRFTKMIE